MCGNSRGYSSLSGHEYQDVYEHSMKKPTDPNMEITSRLERWPQLNQRFLGKKVLLSWGRKYPKVGPVHDYVSKEDDGTGSLKTTQDITKAKVFDFSMLSLVRCRTGVPLFVHLVPEPARKAYIRAGGKFYAGDVKGDEVKWDNHPSKTTPLSGIEMYSLLEKLKPSFPDGGLIGITTP